MSSVSSIPGLSSIPGEPHRHMWQPAPEETIVVLAPRMPHPNDVTRARLEQREQLHRQEEERLREVEWARRQRATSARLAEVPNAHWLEEHSTCDAMIDRFGRRYESGSPGGSAARRRNEALSHASSTLPSYPQVNSAPPSGLTSPSEPLSPSRIPSPRFPSPLHRPPHV